ncbi:hypothetical protein N7449_009226, partial [Penicillium cf. viridicatum]
LEIYTSKDSRLAIHDQGRLQLIINKLAQPERYSSGSGIRLRPNIISLNSTRPILFTNGDARLVFLFTNVIYIFGNDVDSLSGVTDFLISYIRIQSASSFPIAIRPRVLVILTVRPEDIDEQHLQIELFYHQLYSLGDKSLSESFSGINFVYLDKSLSPTARFKRLRALIKGQTQDITILYRDNSTLPSAT